MINIAVWHAAIKEALKAIIPIIIVIIGITFIAIVIDGFAFDKLLQTFRNLLFVYLTIVLLILLLFIFVFRYRIKLIIVTLFIFGSFLLLGSFRDTLAQQYIGSYVYSFIDLELFSVALAVLTYGVAIYQISPSYRKGSLNIISKGGKMLYIFNSSYDPQYQRNLFNTLSLPHGSTNEYRYTHKVTRSNVSDAVIQALPNMKGQEVLISYIDRWGKDEGGIDAYQYYPIRKAKFIEGEIDGDRVYIRVQLLDIIHPKDKNAFMKKMIESLPNIPRLTNNDPKEEADGHYAIIADNICKGFDFDQGEQAWMKCVDSISKTAAYTNAQNKQYVYVRSELCLCDRDKKIIKAKLGNDKNSFLPLTKGRIYLLCITYKYPFQRTSQHPTPVMKFEVSDNIIPTSNLQIPIDSHSNRFEFKFEVKPDSKMKTGIIKSWIQAANTSYQIFGPQTDMVLKIGESISFWAQVIVALLLFGILSFASESVSGLQTWHQLVIVLFQTLTIFWLWFISGKKQV